MGDEISNNVKKIINKKKNKKKIKKLQKNKIKISAWAKYVSL